MRRPAGVVPVRRRPAAAHAVDVAVSLKEGREIAMEDLRFEDLETGQVLEIGECHYYGEKTKVCGTLSKVEMEGGHIHLHMKLCGTTSESILKMHYQDTRKDFVVHKCPKDCGLLESGDRYIHGKKVRLVTSLGAEDPWMRTLEPHVPPEKEDGIDEMKELRDKGRMPDEERGRGSDRSEDSSRKRKRKRSKEKKKKKKRSKEKESKDKKKDRSRSRREVRSEDKLDGRNPRVAAMKAPSALFAGTPLDSKEKVRRRVLHRARNYVRKKGRSSKDSENSSSSGSTGESSSHLGESTQEGIFLEMSKAKMLAEQYPGVLCLESLKAMRRTLLTELGEDLEDTGTKPVAVPYFRQHLMKKVSAPAGRELLTLSTSIDLLLKGRVCHALDCMVQRMKSVEAIAGGAAWQVAQRMEVVASENLLIAQATELKGAQRENYEEARALWQASQGHLRLGKGKGGKNDHDVKGKGDGKKGGKQKEDKGGKAKEQK